MLTVVSSLQFLSNFPVKTISLEGDMGKIDAADDVCTDNMEPGLSAEASLPLFSVQANF